MKKNNSELFEGGDNNNIFHIGVLKMLQRSFCVVKIHLFQFINVYAHWVVVGHLG